MICTMTAGIDTHRPAGAGLPSPAATRPRRRTLKDPRLLVGIALVALSVLLGARLLAEADDTVQVWAARSRLLPGQPVAAGALVPREVRFAGQADADRYLDASGDAPAGLTVTREVGAGELLPRAALAGDEQAGALTELPLSVPAEQVPDTVHVGSVVDVWVTPDRSRATLADNPPGEAVRVFRGVTVVAAPRGGTTLGPSATRQVIVGVTRGQAARLPTALAQLSAGTVLVTRQR
jgi:hypothetical protein